MFKPIFASARWEGVIKSLRNCAPVREATVCSSIVFFVVARAAIATKLETASNAPVTAEVVPRLILRSQAVMAVAAPRLTLRDQAVMAEHVIKLTVTHGSPRTGMERIRRMEISNPFTRSKGAAVASEEDASKLIAIIGSVIS